jgi:hypothetical protein
MLALQIYRASFCPGGCGQKRSDGTSHERDGITFGARKVRCRACDELATAQEAYEGTRPQALLWWTEKR